jgi:aminoglycoside 3-N-acetyltransferase
MLHASVRAVGWVVGGPNQLLGAVLDALAPDGTLLMYVGSEDSTYEMPSWPAAVQEKYRSEMPTFDPRTTPAYRKWSILCEYLRTWPGSLRSDHPDSSFAAVGPRALELLADQPLDYCLGRGSPLERLCEAGGSVLVLGSPLDNLTLLHYSEATSELPQKRVVRFQAPVLRGGRRVWVDIEGFDLGQGIVDWPGDDYFGIIARAYLESGWGRSGRVGGAQSYVFDARDLHRFGTDWMERELARL